MGTVQQAEDKVEHLVREIARRHRQPGGRLPDVDAGEISQVLNAVREACDATRGDLMAVLADAWSLYMIEDDDMDGFVRTMTEQMPAEWWAAREQAKKDAP